MNTIRLYCTETGWMARYRGAGASLIRELFGTDTLPTAFTRQASWQEVKATIEHLNPGCRVEVQL
jgi:hypothetical protein